MVTMATAKAINLQTRLGGSGSASREQPEGEHVLANYISSSTFMR